MNSFQIITETLKERTVVRSSNSEFCIIYINSGTGKYLYHNDIDLYLPNSVFLLTPETQLSLTPTSKFICTITVLKFNKDFLSNRSLFSQSLKLIDSFSSTEKEFLHIFLSSTSGQAIHPFLEIITTEYTDLKPLSWYLIQNTLASLLVYIARIYDFSMLENTPTPITTKNNLIEYVKVSIENNYEQPISLNTLAKEYYVNASYLSHCFKKKTGISLIDFLITTRIQHAKLLLMDTDELIIDIANSCGFNTIAHFNSCFKRLEECTPSQYRNKYKKKIKESLLTSSN